MEHRATPVVEPPVAPEPDGRGGVGPFDRNGLRILDRDDCLHHLGTATFGRIALTMAALPVVLPVSYRLVDGRVVIRTSAGAKLAAAMAGTVVAFEIDHMDPLDHTGWSVLVTGTARVVDDPDDLARCELAGVPRWAPQGDDRYVAIDAELLSGRALGG